MECSNLFLKTKYTKWYYNIISRAKQRTRTPDHYYEEHHVVPRSIGDKDGWTVYLTAKEHYICHVLLFKIVINPKHRRSMAYALWSFKGKSHWHGRRFTGAMYETIRKDWSNYNSGKNNAFYGKGHLVSGEKNHFWGKKHTKVTIDKIKATCREKSTGKNNAFYGKHHTAETKTRLSNWRRGRTFASGPYRLVSSDGIEYIVSEGIYKFCREHNLVAQNVIQAAQKGHKSKGWIVELYEKNSN
jgi:hypothetical protein